jgi:hypothetical protein
MKSIDGIDGRDFVPRIVLNSEAELRDMIVVSIHPQPRGSARPGFVAVLAGGGRYGR